MNDSLTELQAPEDFANLRLDQALARLLPDYSRSRIQQWIKAGQVWVNTEQIRAPKSKLLGGERLQVSVSVEPEVAIDQAEAISLDIVYEDTEIIVLNKPAGLVVHPAVGNRQGTLLNGLLHHAAELQNLPRAGIVHRLDKDTSGLMVVAKTLKAHKHLVDQLSARSVSREYEAVVLGNVIAGGTIDEPIGRHAVDRKKMAVKAGGKQAITHYRVKTRFRNFTHLAVKLETGRTHQIRVHLAHKHFPIIGDPAYGGRPRFPAGLDESLANTLNSFRRQALHACALTIIHPNTLEEMSWRVELPADLVGLLEQLQRHAV